MEPAYYKPMSYRDTEARVLRRHIFGDFGLIAVLFTASHGKVSVYHKTLRKYEKFGGVLDIASHNEICFSNTVWGSRPLIRATTIDKFYPMHKDATKIYHTLQVVELLREYLPENEAYPTLFKICLDILDRIRSKDTPTYYRDVLLFYSLFLKETGYLLCTEHCVSCRQSAMSLTHFSFSDGGALCTACASHTDNAISLSAHTFGSLHILLQFDSTAIATFSPTPSHALTLFSFFKAYLTYIIGKPLKTEHMQAWL